MELRPEGHGYARPTESSVDLGRELWHVASAQVIILMRQTRTYPDEVPRYASNSLAGLMFSWLSAEYGDRRPPPT